MTGEHPEAFVQLLGQGSHGLGILCQHCLPPAVGDRFQDRDEAGRRLSMNGLTLMLR
jgi:hypothetical protein